jgi:subtilisin family serine protease
MPSVQPDQVAMAKLDIFLFQMQGQFDRAQARAKARGPGAMRTADASEDAVPDAADDCVPARASVYIWFTGDPEDLRRLGFEGVILEKPTRKTANGTVPIERLRDIAAIEHVVAIQGPRPVVPQLDYSTTEIGIPALRAQYPEYTGEGVVIVVVDSGIDWRHGAFIDDSNNTRLLAYWDRSYTPQPGVPAPGPPGLGGQGIEYDAARINRALRGTATIPIRDGSRSGPGTTASGRSHTARPTPPGAIRPSSTSSPVECRAPAAAR